MLELFFASSQRPASAATVLVGGYERLFDVLVSLCRLRTEFLNVVNLVFCAQKKLNE